MIGASLMVSLCVWLGLDQIVVGIAITLAGEGITSVLQGAEFGTSYPRLGAPSTVSIPLLEKIPVLGPSLFDQPLIVYLGFAFTGFLVWMFRATNIGLNLRAAGEKPGGARRRRCQRRRDPQLGGAQHRSARRARRRVPRDRRRRRVHPVHDAGSGLHGDRDRDAGSRQAGVGGGRVVPVRDLPVDRDRAAARRHQHLHRSGQHAAVHRDHRVAARSSAAVPTCRRRCAFPMSEEPDERDAPATEAPCENRTLREQVVDHLREEILANRLAPGTELGEVALAQSLGISRGPLREALGQLAAEGLVTIVPRRGAVVKRLTRQEFLDAYQVREALESLAIRLAVPRLETPTEAKLRRMCEANGARRPRQATPSVSSRSTATSTRSWCGPRATQDSRAGARAADRADGAAAEASRSSCAAGVAAVGGRAPGDPRADRRGRRRAGGPPARGAHRGAPARPALCRRPRGAVRGADEPDQPRRGVAANG